MARYKHKGGQADLIKQHVLGVTTNLVDASTVNSNDNYAIVTADQVYFKILIYKIRPLNFSIIKSYVSQPSYWQSLRLHDGVVKL
ncbi:hypothetical protein KY289_016179 [Solanum tuberosum]|nr:hypothetical protein KY289_016179 [Solanum tuberosum]